MGSLPEDRLSRIETQLASLHDELYEIGMRLPDWDYKSAVYGKRYRAIAERVETFGSVALVSRRFRCIVKEARQGQWKGAARGEGQGCRMTTIARQRRDFKGTDAELRPKPDGVEG